MSTESRKRGSALTVGSRAARALLLGAGILLVLVALLYNEVLLGLVDPHPPLARGIAERTRHAQLAFLAIGIALILLSEFVARVPRVRSLLERRSVARLLLFFLVLFLPMIILEISLRVFSRSDKTTIFVRDAELGWKLRPGHRDAWWNRVVEVNGKGLQGPELEYAKPPGVVRILYLGDSVTFGDGLESFEQSFPSVAEPMLEREVGREVETINAGMPGYSAWQEYAYLRKEGFRYDPDLVVLSFVLNDVTEKFGLRRFGGAGEGWQLSRTFSSRLDKFLEESGLWWGIREVKARLAFGSDVRAGAKKKEGVGVRTLAWQPERPDVERAWAVTIRELDDIVAFCRARNLPLLLVVFPFTFQFDDPVRLNAPQKLLVHYAAERGIPVVDLLPLLLDRARAERLDPQAYFIDQGHPSPMGNRVVAEILTEHIARAARDLRSR